MCQQVVVQYLAYQVEVFLPAKSACCQSCSGCEKILFGIVDTDWHEFSTLYLCDGGSQAMCTMLVGWKTNLSTETSKTQILHGLPHHSIEMATTKFEWVACVHYITILLDSIRGVVHSQSRNPHCIVGCRNSWCHLRLELKVWGAVCVKIKPEWDIWLGLSDHYLPPFTILQHSATSLNPAADWTQQITEHKMPILALVRVRSMLESTWPYCWKLICSWSWKSYDFFRTQIEWGEPLTSLVKLTMPAPFSKNALQRPGNEASEPL